MVCIVCTCISDAFRFQQQKLCNAAPHSHDSEEECGQEDEGSYGKSDLTVESTDEAKGKMPLSDVPQSGQCKKRTPTTEHLLFYYIVYCHQVKVDFVGTQLTKY